MLKEKAMKVILTGSVGKDPELKFIQGNNGDFAVTRFSVAETERVKKGDEWIDGETHWYNVSCTGRLAETIIDVVSKGTRVKVEGELKHFSYEKDGETKSGIEIRANDITLVPTAQKKTNKVKEDEAWPF